MPYDFKSLIQNDFSVADIPVTAIPEQLLNVLNEHCLMFKDQRLKEHIYYLDDAIENEEINPDEIDGLWDLYNQVIRHNKYSYIRLIS